MKVAIDTIFFNRRYSGISVVWYTLLENLEADGYEIILFKRASSYLPPQIAKKYKVVHINDFIGEFEDIPYINTQCLFNGINYFISTYYTYSTVVPCLVWIHDMIPEIFGYDFNTPMWGQKRRCIINGKYFACVSRTTQQDFRRYYPNKKNFNLIYNCLDPNRLNSEDSSIRQRLQINKPFFISIASNTDPYKNPAALIRLFQDYPSLFDTFDFVFLSDKFSQNPGIKWAPKISNEELTFLYKNCVGTICPSLYEGFGIPVLEAMSHKKNVIAHGENPATKEIAEDNCVYFNTIEELRNRIYEVYEGKHKNKIDSGYKRAMSFSPQQQTLMFNQLINSLP